MFCLSTVAVRRLSGRTCLHSADAAVTLTIQGFCFNIVLLLEEDGVLFMRVHLTVMIPLQLFVPEASACITSPDANHGCCIQLQLTGNLKSEK